MKNLLFNFSKASIGSIIALLIIVGLIVISSISLCCKVADKDLAILIVGNMYGLAGFVAGYYFNKKADGVNDNLVNK
jgi:hypothetical protein